MEIIKNVQIIIQLLLEHKELIILFIVNGIAIFATIINIFLSISVRNNKIKNVNNSIN